MSRTPVVFDTDPGIDDALALAYLVAMDDTLDLRAITVVAGNVDVDRGVGNTRRLATLFGIAEDVPVHRGCPKPLLQPLHTAEFVHGSDGVGEAELPEATVAAADEHAVAALLRLSHEHAGELALVPVGPLTNIAAALILDPTFAERVADVVIMGGAFRVPGNIPPAKVAEANISNDPEAARIVVESGIPHTMIGLDVTHQALVTQQMVDELPDDTAALRAMATMFTHYIGRYAELQGMDGCPLHDPLAVAVAADPSWVRLERGAVRVETGSAYTSGTTVFDDEAEDAGGGTVAVDMGREGFAEHFMTTITERWG